jgi:putative ABC transport system permease protein
VTRIFAYLAEAGISLWRNKGRTVLTMLGMIIGTSSIITVFGLSKAATSGIDATFASFGSIPVSAQVDDSQPYPDRAQLRYTDASAVAADLGSLVKEVQPDWTRTWKVQAGKVSDYLNVSTTGPYQDDSLKMNEGRKIGQDDVDSAARVVAVSQSVADKYFPHQPAVGRVLDINGNRYQIVGVYAPFTSPLLTSLAGSDYLVIPYSTFHRASDDPPDDISVFPVDPIAVNAIEAKVKATLQHIHGPQAQYDIVDGAAQLKSFENVLNIVGVGLGAIGTVALIVAGIGIMNIMLVTVTERTKEIGLRKSIGASRNDIMLQFLMESIVLALLGGGVGMLFGIGVSAFGATLISKSLGAVVVPYVLVISVALGFSGAVGMLFGLYPAFRAARLDPIEALRS